MHGGSDGVLAIALICVSIAVRQARAEFTAAETAASSS